MILPLFLYNFTPIRNGTDTYFCAVEMRLHKCQKTQKTDMIMKHNFSLLCAATCALSFFSMNDAQALKVHTIGDSTMANYEEGTTDKRGWGQMLNQFFMGDIEVNNRAKSGASSKSFYNEAPYWTTVKQQIAAGDYVFIQFAHNDEKNDGVEYIRLDVRKPIEFDFKPTADDVIFNLAAVHRTPGHPDHEYFETNIRGAENVTAFAEKHGINKILFTSSIAPYGAAEDLKEETTLPTPNTPYGISKLVAEKIHQMWQVKDEKRELTIVRPGIVYGKGEHGNMTRLYKGMKGHYFMYTGRKDTIKASIYVKELVLFFKYRMMDNSFPGTDIFNCTFEPAYNIEQICETMKKATGLKYRIPLIPGGLLMTAATILGPIGGKKVGIHPARVKKLMVSTNICGKKLAACGYKFHYSFEDTFKDWLNDCGGQGLF